eukprot:12356677-Alexandrium_andersonii.AAC.1
MQSPSSTACLSSRSDAAFAPAHGPAPLWQSRHSSRSPSLLAPGQAGGRWSRGIGDCSPLYAGTPA